MTKYQVEKTEDTIKIKLYSYGGDYKTIDSLVSKEDLVNRNVELDITNVDIGSFILNTISSLIFYNTANRLNIRIVDDSKTDRLDNLDSYLEKSRIKKHANFFYPRELIKEK